MSMFPVNPGNPIKIKTIIWLFIGAIAVLFPIFTIITTQNLKRQKQIGLRLLKDKGTSLIRSVEAGSRIGMMERLWGLTRLQNLIAETAKQPDIEYMLITDSDGGIIAHSDPIKINTNHSTDLDLQKIVQAADKLWYRIVGSDDKVRLF